MAKALTLASCPSFLLKTAGEEDVEDYAEQHGEAEDAGEDAGEHWQVIQSPGQQMHAGSCMPAMIGARPLCSAVHLQTVMPRCISKACHLACRTGRLEGRLGPAWPTGPKRSRRAARMVRPRYPTPSPSRHGAWLEKVPAPAGYGREGLPTSCMTSSGRRASRICAVSAGVAEGPLGVSLKRRVVFAAAGPAVCNREAECPCLHVLCTRLPACLPVVRMAPKRLVISVPRPLHGRTACRLRLLARPGGGRH